MKKKATDLTAPAEQKDTGAPANLRRMELHEADAEKEVNSLKERIKAVQALIAENGDEDAQKPIREQVASLRMQLDSAYDLWFKLSKQVRDFDKSVKESRREGEQISVAECLEFWRQFELSMDLAIEQLAVADSQSAALCDDPAKWYATHAENYRAAKQGVVAAAIAEGVIPKWLAR